MCFKDGLITGFFSVLRCGFSMMSLVVFIYSSKNMVICLVPEIVSILILVIAGGFMSLLPPVGLTGLAHAENKKLIMMPW
jgi:hypothetical protein